MGGFSRTKRSKQYIFSGFLSCGLCGSNIVIVFGNGRRGYVKYGCPGHRCRGLCRNNVLIRQDCLEEHLITGLTQKVLSPDLIEYMFRRFVEELQKRLQTMELESLRAATELDALRAQREVLKANNIAEAIAAMGHSPTLLAQLSSAESEIGRLDSHLSATNKPLELAANINEMREFVTQKALDLTSVLRSDVTTARRGLANHVQKN